MQMVLITSQPHNLKYEEISNHTIRFIYPRHANDGFRTKSTGGTLSQEGIEG